MTIPEMLDRITYLERELAVAYERVAELTNEVDGYAEAAESYRGQLNEALKEIADTRVLGGK